MKFNSIALIAVITVPLSAGSLILSMREKGMKFIEIHSTPNVDGLTSMLGKTVLEGAESKGAETELVHLKQSDIRSCEAYNPVGRG